MVSSAITHNDESSFKIKYNKKKNSDWCKMKCPCGFFIQGIYTLSNFDDSKGNVVKSLDLNLRVGDASNNH